jgi:hypothetical protein
MKNLFFRIALAIGFASVSTAIMAADTLMAWDNYYGGNWTSSDCQWTSSSYSDRGGNIYTTRTLSCYGGSVLNYTYVGAPNGAPVNILDPQFYYVTARSGTGAPNAYNFSVMKREQVTGFPKSTIVVTPGVAFGQAQQSSFPFRVLNAPSGATYQFFHSIGPGTPTPIGTTPQPLPAGSLDKQSGMTVTTLYVNTGNLDLRASRTISLKIFDSTGKNIATGSASASDYIAFYQHHNALNAFYVNRAGQNVVDYQYGFNTSGRVRAGGNLFNPEIASIRTNTDNHGNPGLKCMRGGSPSCGTFDVTGGWFDAGDQGKYAQNAAVSLWHLFNLIEKDMPFLKTNPSDTSINANAQRNIWRTHNYNLIPENPNALVPGATFNAPAASATELPNIVKEARYEMEWLLKMQVNSSYYYLFMDLPLGNQDVNYSSSLGYGVQPVTTTAYQYSNYLQVASLKGTSLFDPGTNAAIPLYRQILKFTKDVNVEGMVFHAVHDDEWTEIPMLPQNNTKKRVLEYPTSAATLSFAAVAAQCYRVFKAIDPSFANRCWDASTKAFNAYKPNGQLVYFYGEYSNAVNAPMASIVKGAGAYADLRLNDLIYWANMERYLTTVDKNQQETAEARNYLRNINLLSEAAPFVSDKFPIKSASWLLAYNWSNTAALGSLSAITVNPEKFTKAKVTFINNESTGASISINSPATNLINYVNNTLTPNALNNPWGLPLPADFAFEWGSNHEIINAGILVANAIRLDAIDQGANLPRLKPEAKAIPQQIVYYMLGSNPLNISMVTGQGWGRSANNIHHRVFAKQADLSANKVNSVETTAGWLVGGANGQIPQAVLSASREAYPGETNQGVFNGGTIMQNGGSLGGYKQLMEVLPRCREADGTVRSAMCHSNNYWSYHTNEVAINWQASWLWLSSFVRR